MQSKHLSYFLSISFLFQKRSHLFGSVLVLGKIEFPKDYNGFLI